MPRQKGDLPADQDGVFFQQQDGNIIFANRHIRIEFVKKGDKLILTSLYGQAASQDFISTHPKTRSSLWELVFCKDTGKDDRRYKVCSLDNAFTSYSLVRANKDQATLILNWNGLGVGDEENIIDVKVELTLKADMPGSLWRMHVTNRGKKYGLWCAYLPVIKLVPIGGKARENYFAIGKSRGVLVNDPFHSDPLNAFGFGAQKGMRWPGVLNMQFQALYDSTGDGLYLATYDGDGYMKEFQFSPDPRHDLMEYKIGHYPSNMGFPGEDYHMSYDVVLGPFIGDWYDAAQIYRAWALEQVWCGKGVLKDRLDIPAWFKEAPVMLKVLSKKGEDDLNVLKNRVINFIRFIGADLPINWYTWKRIVPETTAYNSTHAKSLGLQARSYPRTNIHDGNYPVLPALTGFSTACKEISQAGGHVLPYVCARLFDQGVEENAPFAKEARPNTVTDVHGNIKYDAVGVLWTMCYHTTWWQNRLKETVMELIKRENARGIYFDTFYGGNIQCFDTKHGHSHGGGRDSYLGARKLSQAVRDSMKDVDHDSIMTGENPAETAIDLLDGFLYQWNTWPDMIPLFASVYGDSIPRYGMDLDPASDGFYIQSAALFTEGAIIGRLSLHGDDFLKDVDKGSPYTAKMEFLRKISFYRHCEPGAAYLVYGQLLRPLRLMRIEPDQSVSYYEKSQRYKDGFIRVKTLQTGVFRANDGSIGVFIVNISDRKSGFTFGLSPEDYPISNESTYDVMRINERGQMQSVESRTADTLIFEDEIAAHDVFFLCIKVKDH